jgi:hypothetical protein
VVDQFRDIAAFVFMSGRGGSLLAGLPASPIGLIAGLVLVIGLVVLVLS